MGKQIPRHERPAYIAGQLSALRVLFVGVFTTLPREVRDQAEMALEANIAQSMQANCPDDFLDAMTETQAWLHGPPETPLFRRDSTPPTPPDPHK